MIAETDFKQAYRAEKFYSGKHGKFGLQIRVAIDREFVNEDNRIMDKVAEEIEEAIMRVTVANDPEEQRERDEEQKRLMECFGDRNIFAEAIPNQYCSRWCCSMKPWYRVTTSKGVVTIGWRKRVISITYDVRVTGGVDANNLFPNEDVTRVTEHDSRGLPTGYTIHAYGYEKAKQYLETILSFYTPEK